MDSYGRVGAQLHFLFWFCTAPQWLLCDLQPPCQPSGDWVTPNVPLSFLHHMCSHYCGSSVTQVRAHTHTHCKNSCTGSVFPLGALHNSLIIKSFTLMTPGGANVVITDTAIHWICFVTPVVSIFQLNNVSEWTQTQDSQAGWGCLLWRQDEQDMRRLADWMHTDRGEHKKTGRTWKINRDKVQTENTESPAQETWHHFHC